MRISKYILVIFVFIIGCHNSPKKLNRLEEILHESQTYWSWHNVPHLRKKGYKKIAITEFNVEFVTLKMATMTSSMVDPIALTPIEPGLDLLGVGREEILFPADLKRKLCSDMYDMFVHELELREFQVVSHQQIQSSISYSHFTTQPQQQSEWVKLIDPIASDTGRIKKYEVVPYMRIITGTKKSDIEEIEKELIAEVDADVSLRVRFRVGVYANHASLERNSVIQVTGRKFAGNIFSNRSMLSRNTVIEDVNSLTISQKYVTEISNIFPFYLNLATTAIREEN